MAHTASKVKAVENNSFLLFVLCAAIVVRFPCMSTILGDGDCLLRSNEAILDKSCHTSCNHHLSVCGPGSHFILLKCCLV